MNHRRVLSRLALLPLLGAIVVLSAPVASSPGGPTNPIPGQTLTQLGDGRWLSVGGQGAQGAMGTAAIYDYRTGKWTGIAGLHQPRAWHTATVLADGSVLVFGGIGPDGRTLAAVELLDTNILTWITPPESDLTPRSEHSATLLTDRRVLIAGGKSGTGHALAQAELWDFDTGRVDSAPTPMSTARRGHSATLLPPGTVLLWGGTDQTDTTLRNGDLFDPDGTRFTGVANRPPEPQPSESARLEASLPATGAADVSVDAVIALRFSKPLQVDTATSATVTLSGPNGPEHARVVAAESGRLVFVTPHAALTAGAHYTVSVNGGEDVDGLLLPFTSVGFMTVQRKVSDSKGKADGGVSADTGGDRSGRSDGAAETDTFVWTGEVRDGKPYSSWQSRAPLQARAGVTALAGQVLRLDGEPLADVTVRIVQAQAKTDDTGRFLLDVIPAGRAVLLIDGRSASSSGRTYGVFEVGLEITADTTNVLPFTIWMPLVDTAHAVTIPSPTVGEVMVTSPRIPGLELHIPPSTVIRDHLGHVARTVSLTQIPLDRTPFPLPPNVNVPLYFTAQPGAGYLENSTGAGARIFYPNRRQAAAGSRFDFWHYEPDDKGWFVYGQGRVRADGTQIIPDPGIGVYEFTGAMVAPTSLAPQTGPPPGEAGFGGDPVSLSTGLFVLQKTDFALPGILPITLTRTYRQNDTRSRAFGIGASPAYELFLTGNTNPFTFMDLILPDGGRIHYQRRLFGDSCGSFWSRERRQHGGEDLEPQVFFVA